MVFNRQELLNELKEKVEAHINFIDKLQAKPEKLLTQRLSDKSWSVLECIEHLNLYASFYNKEISKRLHKAKNSNNETFKPGYLGNKSALDMLPKNDMKTMNTFKSKNPIHSNLAKDEVLESFISHQKELIKLLEKASTKSLTKIKTSLTIPILKFRLGDTFRFVIYHNERHIQQAKNILSKLN